MNKSIWVGAVLVTVAVIGGLVYLRYGQPGVVQESAQSVTDSSHAPPVTQPTASTADTIPTESADVSTAVSDGSDKVVQSELESLFGSTLHAWLFPERIIKRIVATVDSLDGDPMPLRLRPLRYVEGQLLVDAAQDGSLTLSPDNAKRYAPYVETLSRVDAKRVANFYFRYQVSFQKAHEELGYHGQSFNDRLLKTIDHLLAAPEIAPPIRLVRPHVLYEFDDSKLEQLSSGQKIMVRMGSQNAAAVKAKLREIRAALIAAPGG
jgi:hypothetical protein